MSAARTPRTTKKKKTSRKASADSAEDLAQSRCIALVGEEAFFLNDDLTRIERVLFGEKGAGPSRVEAQLKPKPGEDSSELLGILDDIRTPSLFGGKKLIVLRGAESLVEADRDSLMSALDSIPPPITVVFLMDKLRKSSKLEKHLLKVGVVKRFKAMYDRPGPWQKGAAEHDHELGRWVTGRAREHGLTITPVDAHRLVKRTGNHPARLDGELEKLSLLLDEGATVKAEDIDALSPDSQEFRSFDLADAVIDRRRAHALHVLDAMLREGMVGSDHSRIVFAGAIGGLVIGALRSKLVLLLRARTLLDGGQSSTDVFTELRVAPFLRDAVSRQVRSWTTTELREAIRQLLRTDLDLKGGTAFPEATLARLVVQLTGGGPRA